LLVFIVLPASRKDGLLPHPRFQLGAVEVVEPALSAHLAATNTSVVISSLHDHDRGQAEGVRASSTLALYETTCLGALHEQSDERRGYPAEP